MEENNDKEIFKKYCQKYIYQPVILKNRRRIVVLGDIHGDYKLTLKLLKIAKVIEMYNNKIKWIGGDTIVVQIGDQIDRCRPINNKTCEDPFLIKNDEDSDIKILKLFTKLHEKAVKKKGAVISLIGNHELLNVKGNMNYVSYEGLKGFENYIDPENKEKKFKSGKEARIYAFKPGKEYGKLLACTRVPFVIIGSWLFVHGGIVPELLKKLNIKNKDNLKSINYIIRKWLLGLIDGKYISDIIGSFEYSIFWNRILGGIPPDVNFDNEKCIKYLKPVLNILEINNMVIGHTPQYYKNGKGINSTCENKLWRIDTGSSNAFNKFDPTYIYNNIKSINRHAQVLEIIDDKIINVLK